MNSNYCYLKVSDGQSLAYKKWNDTVNPKGVIIIIHGMAEHIERYDNFASNLNRQGFIVYGSDLRGHGNTSGKKGFFAHKNGWKRVIDDQKEFYNFVKRENLSLDISYFAHSAGSIIARYLMATTSIINNKIVLSGTTFEGKFKTLYAKNLSAFLSKTKGQGKDAIFIDGLVNGGFASSIQHPITKFDWLTRDHIEVAKYINDSNCGFICTNQFYNDFFKLMYFANKKSYIKKTDKSLKVLLVSGDCDPVGGTDAKGVKKLSKIYSKNGLNCELYINKNGRHESINEINKDEVYQVINNFYNS